MPEPDYKIVKHYNEPGHLHFLTFSCYRQMPLLTNDLFRSWLARSLDKALDTHNFQLSAFVFMPDHVHLLVWPLKKVYSISDFQQSLKRPFSSRIKDHLIETGSTLLQRLTVQERPGKQVFRFWQEGGGHDLNVWSEKYIRTKLDYIHNNPVQRRLVSTPDRWRWSSWRIWNRPELPRDPELPNTTLLNF